MPLAPVRPGIRNWPIVTRSRAFSRILRQLPVITLSFVLPSSFVIGYSNYFGFGFGFVTLN